MLTFYEFPQTMHRYIRTTNAIESLFSNVRQRTDQIDVFTLRVELPDHRLGHHRGQYSEKNPRVMDQVTTREGAVHNRT